jgi:hypothetical protein
MRAMATLRTTFLENPISVYIILGIAFVVLAAIWHERRTRRRRLLLLVPPVLAVLIFVVEASVVTDREQIVAAVRDIAKCVETGNTQGILRHLDEEFIAYLHGRSLRKMEVPGAVEQARSSYGITRINLYKDDVEIESDRAKMHAATMISWSRGSAHAKTSIIWDMVWIKRPEGWRILTVREPQYGLEF